MNNKFFRMICLLFVCGIIISCNVTDTKFPVMPNTMETPADNQIFFKVNGEQVQTSAWNISRFDMGRGTQLNITSNMHVEKRTIAFNINGCKPGTYALQLSAKNEGTAYGNYKPDYENMLNSFAFTDGELIIEGIDTSNGFLNARFHGTAKNSTGSFSITDGQIIKGRFKTGQLNITAPYNFKL